MINAIILSVLALIFIILWVVKPYLYEKYYMPEVLFDSNGNYAFKKYMYPFRWTSYTKYNWHGDDKFTYWDSRIQWHDLGRHYHKKSKEEVASLLIEKYLSAKNKRIFKHVYQTTPDDTSDVDVIRFKDVKKRLNEKRIKEMERLLDIDDEEKFLEEWQQLKVRQRN